MVKDLNESAACSKLPWQLSVFSDAGEVVIEIADESPSSQNVVCEIRMNDPEDSREIVRVRNDARRVIAAVNFTQNLPLELLEDMATEPLSPPASQADSQQQYFDDEE